MTTQWSDVDRPRGLAIEQRVKSEDSFANCYNALFPEVFHAGIGVAVAGNEAIEEVGTVFNSNFDESDLMNLLMVASMYVDKHGMVPFRKRREGQLPEVVDFFSGKFARRIHVDGEVEYGWLNNARNAEDSAVKIYIDPIHGPSLSETDPYNSLISTLLHHLENMFWMRIDHSQMYYQLSHPPFGIMSSTGSRALAKIDPSENAFVDAANAGAQGLSIVASSERRFNDESTETVDKHFNAAVSRAAVEGARVRHEVNGLRTETFGMQAWATRRIKLPDGYEPVAFQQPQYVSIQENEEALSNRIHRLLGVPMTESSGGGNRLATSINAQRDSLKKSIARRREQMKNIFKYVFDNFLHEALVSDFTEKKDVIHSELESHPITYLEYYRWMVNEEKLRDHPVIDTMIEQVKDERRRRFAEQLEQTTNKLLLEAEREGTLLDRDVVLSHLTAISRNAEAIGTIQEKLDGGLNYSLVFNKTAFHDREVLLEMHDHGLISPQAASEMILLNEGTDEITAAKLSQGCTGISPTDSAKLELEYEKLKVQKINDKLKEGKGQPKKKKQKNA